MMGSLDRFRGLLRTRAGTLATIGLALMPMLLMFDLSALAANGGPSSSSIVDKLLVQLAGVAAMVLVIVVVVMRLPKIDVGHPAGFRRRRAMNWLPIGLAYAFLYMARYNLNTLNKMGFIEPTDFSIINTAFAITYGISFVINGPLTDRFGGKATMMLGVLGAGTINLVLGLMVPEIAVGTSGKGSPLPSETITLFTVMTAINAYFQSFG
ncbi:MAG: hypothetical protein JNJ59_27660, partial [Deltaproteobacteria bacterium]|nr:hypothetical protein [Deltaproteobacteria bacterium]